MRNLTEQNLTDAVLAKLEGATDARFKQVMSSLIKHLHAFVREVELTEQTCRSRAWSARSWPPRRTRSSREPSCSSCSRSTRAVPPGDRRCSPSTPWTRASATASWSALHAV